MKRKLLLFFLFTVLSLLPTTGNAQITAADSGGCLLSGDVWFPVGTVAGHNTYETLLTSSFIYTRVRWSTGNNRWEIVADVDGDGNFNDILHYNNTNTIPNPPALGIGTWSATPFGCGTLTAFSGPYTSTTAPAPSITTQPVNKTVCNSGNTTFSVSATGATSYQWQYSSGGTFSNVPVAAPFSGTTSATLTITGATTVLNGFQFRVVVTGSGSTTSQNATLTVSNVSGSTTITNVLCNGNNTGAIDLTPTGGTAPYTYNWGGGITTQNRTNLTAGNYSVTITDANNCTGVVNATITQPATALGGTATKTDVSCTGGGNGTATVVATGGAIPYSYSWAPSGGTNATATGLAANTYTVTVTDFNGCQITRSVTVGQPATALGGTATKTDVSCNGGSNGTATVVATGGTTPYSYSWAPSGGTNATATGLAAGTYTVTVTDFNGCSITRSVMVNQPANALAASSGGQTNVSCRNGSNGTATVDVTGGTGTYTYSWAPSGGTSATASGLAAGTYTVTVTDANSCQATQSFTITQPANALAASSGGQTNVSCSEGSNGSATVDVTGGTGTYTYSWAPSGGTSATASGLAAGTYTVTVTDANNCQATQSFTITEPAIPLTITSLTKIDATCENLADGSAVVVATGGTGAYTYFWSPSGGTAATATNLEEGSYTVTVTDTNGCSATQSFAILYPSPIIVSNQPENETISTGDNATFVVSALNVVDYQWQVSTNGSTWNDVINGGTNPAYSGASTNTLTLAGVPSSFDNYQYRVILSINANCQTISDIATLAVENELQAINDDFSNVVINEGTGGYVGNVLLNDLYNNMPVNSADVLIAILDDGGIDDVSLVTDGGLTIPASALEGNYIITYSICENGNLTNCSQAEVTIVIQPSLSVIDLVAPSIKLYPNPASTEIFLSIGEISAYSNLKVTVYDLYGKRISENKIDENLQRIDISKLPSSIYIFDISYDGGKTTKKVIKY